MSKAQQYEAKQKAAKKFSTTAHSFTKRVFHWPYCSGCGLVLLKNESTARRAVGPCESMED